MPTLSYDLLVPIAPGVTVNRGFVIAFPADWMSLVAVAPLPLVIFFHGSGESASSFLYDELSTLRIAPWLDGTWTRGNPLPLKFIAIAPQGLSLQDDLGGQWDSGIVGTTARMWPVNDEDYVATDLVPRVEALLMEWYQRETPTGAPVAPILGVFDRERVSFVGFSNGGQMAYRMVPRFVNDGWKVKGLGIFSSSIGGWHSYSRKHRGDPEDALWGPSANPGMTPGGSPWPSLFAVHGSADDHVPALENGAVPKVYRDTVAAIDPRLNPHDFIAWSYSGRDSAKHYAHAYRSSFTGPAVTIFRENYPAPVPNSDTTNGESFSVTWAGGLGELKKVTFVYADGLDHSIPEWGFPALASFLLLMGAVGV